MSKTSKPNQKVNEIKDLLLDVIQQEDASMSDTEIARLSRPYKKPSNHDEDINSQVEHDFSVKHQSPKTDDEDSVIKLDFDLHSNDVPEKSSPFNVPKLEKASPAFSPAFPPAALQADKTVKLANAPQSRAPIELKTMIAEEKSRLSSESANESTVRLTPKIRTKTFDNNINNSKVGGNTNSELKFRQEAQIGISSPAEAVLKQSENLRIAQSRITSLEEELDRFRQQNSQLSSAGEILRRRADELLSRSEAVENKMQESAIIFDEEKKVLKAQIQSKDKELDVRRQKVDQLEQRLNSQFDSIKRRERELEHRLEILKIENQDILNGKDKMILDLKRQVDLLNTEANFSKDRTQELYNQHKDKQETIRRVVKALRMALTILEGDEETQSPLKKVD